MKCLDLTFRSPAENLACDEALLDLCESGAADQILRFWEADRYFVVVGYANTIAAEVNVSSCDKAGIPILRRCSGGGAVLQGPGCLNYSLILRIEEGAPTGTITETNAFVMQTNRTALQRLVTEPLEIRGHTDLTVGNMKFSGNAQRRRRRFLLFHGSFLLRLDLTLIGQFLPLPSRQPDYRQGRAHRDFLRHLELPSQSVKEALKQVWRATAPLEQIPHAAISRLAQERYSAPQWNWQR